MEFKIDLHPDLQSVELRMPGQKKGTRMTALELEGFMRELARFRAGMKPPVPDDNLSDQSIFSVVPSIRWSVANDPDAPTQIRLYILHLGFGWIWIPLSESAAAEMWKGIQRQFAARPKLQ